MVHRPWEQMLFGGGLSVAYELTDRVRLIGDVEGTLPRSKRYQYLSGPRDLPTGDTTSAIHAIVESRSCFGFRVGVDGILSRDPGDAHWSVRAVLGYVWDTTRWKDDYVLTYSGEVVHSEGRAQVQYLELCAGPAFSIPTHRGIVGLDLTGSIAYPLVRSEVTGPEQLHVRLIAIGVSYRWRGKSAS